MPSLKADSHPILDSLQHWQNTRQFTSICRAADSLINANTIPACVKMQLLLAASKATVDLYQPKDCLKYAQAVSQIPQRDCRDTLARMEALLQEAFALNMLEEVKKAVPLTEKVINYCENTRNESLLIRAYTHLGMMLNKTGAFESARKMFLKAHFLAQSNPDLRRIATSFANLALCDINLKHFETGLIMVDSAIYFAQQIQLPPLLAHCYGLKSAIQKGLGNDEGWAASLDTAIQISKSHGNLNQAAIGMADRLRWMVQKGQFNEAVKTGNEALQLLDIQQYPLVAKNAYNELYKAFQGLQDYRQALRYLEKYTSLKDSIDTEKSQKEVYELNLKYEVKEKDNAILQQQLELKNSRFLLFLVLGSLVILAFLAFSYSWRHKLQKEVITMLFHKERELEKEIHRLRNLYPTSPPSAPLTPEEQEQDFILHLFLKAREMMETQKLYLNPEFSLHEFVQLLNTNRSYLSQAINEYADGGFRAFLNRYRVEHAKTLLWAIASGDTKIPLGDIWQHAGANSNKSFYRFFKNVTGITPKEYLDELKLEMNNPNPLSETPE